MLATAPTKWNPTTHTETGPNNGGGPSGTPVEASVKLELDHINDQINELESISADIADDFDVTGRATAIGEEEARRVEAQEIAQKWLDDDRNAEDDR